MFGIPNQETLYLFTFVLGKLDPGESLAWHSLDFEVKEAQEMNAHEAVNSGRCKET